MRHIVFIDVIRIDPRKSAAVRDWPVPVNLQELCNFKVEATIFVSFVISHNSVMAVPLGDLSRKGAPEASYVSARCANAESNTSLMACHVSRFDCTWEYLSGLLIWRMLSLDTLTCYVSVCLLLSEGRRSTQVSRPRTSHSAGTFHGF